MSRDEHTITMPSRNREALSKFLQDLNTEVGGDTESKRLLDETLKFDNEQLSYKNDIQPNLQSDDEVGSLMMHGPVKELYLMILNDPTINMFFHQMFSQQSIDGVIPNWQTFIVLLDNIMTHAPVYSDSVMVGLPINALLSWPMTTTAGFACFLNDKVNNALKNILNYWGKFLQSKASSDVLHGDNDKGWFCEMALNRMVDSEGNTFEEQFICDSSKEHWGFKSWDDFFTRRFRSNMRPLTQPDSPVTIANACESAPFRIERNVNNRSTFWIKDQPYSLSHMLNNNPRTSSYIGGTVYQAYLSATSYHRWHSPISGTIVEIENIDGYYFSQTYELQTDNVSANMSQGYISQVAARAAVYIQADNSDIGTLCFLAIGMTEVSTNEVKVQIGQHVTKGDEIGMFHYGGSTHCLIFRPELEVSFDISPNEEPGHDASIIQLRRKIAAVRLKDKQEL